MSDVHDPALESLQHWMQRLVCFPGDLAAGPGAEHVEERILPSDRLSASERLDLYSQQYFLRLGGALEEDFPCVAYAMGREDFWKAVRGYLITHPSTSFTLARLGAKFPEFLARVEHPASDFLVELATLEWACRVAFHAPDDVSVRSDELGEVPMVRWAEARFVPIHAFSLYAFRHPVNAYFMAVKRGETPPLPAPEETFVACYRKDDQVWRMALDAPRHALLAGLLAGETLGEALERVVAAGVDPSALGTRLASWFTQWMQEGFFRAVRFPD